MFVGYLILILSFLKNKGEALTDIFYQFCLPLVS